MIEYDGDIACPFWQGTRTSKTLTLNHGVQFRLSSIEGATRGRLSPIAKRPDIQVSPTCQNQDHTMGMILEFPANSEPTEPMERWVSSLLLWKLDIYHDTAIHITATLG